MNLIRSKSTDQGTPGKLDFGGLVTIELPWRNNQRMISCIPTGVYPLAIVQSPKFGEVLSVSGILDRDLVRIHYGNWAGDTSLGFKSDSDGCIIVGTSAGILNNQLAVLNSHIALAKLIAAFKSNLIAPTLIVLFGEEV